MIRLILFAIKVTVFSVVVLVISQIPVRGKRICDHVRDVVQHGLVQGPVRWVGDHFNFLEGHKAVHALTEKTPAPANKSGDAEHSESDRSRLSGLLKTRH